MDKSLIVIFLMDVLRSTMGDAGVCLNGWHYNSKVNKCYKFFLDKQMFTEAQESCRNNGAILAMPKTKLETNALDELRQHNPEFAWIGAGDSMVEGKWKWNDGDAINGWTYWKAGEPTNFQADEDCMFVDKKGKWYDVPCKRRYPFICEMTVPGCSVPEFKDEYMHGLSSSFTPREKTTRWGPAQNKGPAKRHQEQEGDVQENLDHDEP